MHKIIAKIASNAPVASGFLDNSTAIAIAPIARSKRDLTGVDPECFQKG